MTETQEKRDEFLFRHIGANHIVILPHPTIHTNSFILMTASAVKKYITVPYLHRIVKVVAIHKTTAYVDSVDPLTLKLELEAGKSDLSTKFSEVLLQLADMVNASIIEKFGDGFEYEPRIWSLSLTTTNTDLVMPLIYIQKLDGKGGV